MCVCAGGGGGAGCVCGGGMSMKAGRDKEVDYQRSLFTSNRQHSPSRKIIQSSLTIQGGLATESPWIQKSKNNQSLIQNVPVFTYNLYSPFFPFT